MLNRLMSKVEMITESGCWIWVGACNTAGYGHLVYMDKGKKRWIDTHRASYLLYRGTILKGLVLDHLCMVKCCINPDHLEAVTAQENNVRKNKHITHCPVGHPYNELNTYFHKRSMKRDCKACRSRRSKATWSQFKMSRINKLPPIPSLTS